MRRVAAAMLAVLASATACGQNAASRYPERPIRIIVTFPPGGPTDIIARAVGQKLTDAWGQPVVVDNRAGAGGNIGTDLAAKAAPDGYTLLVSNFGPFAISPFVYAKLPYDPVRDLTPITLAATSWFFLVVHPAVPANSVRELIALARARPDQITYASAGNASPSHLASALFQMSAGIRLTHVPYKGGAPSVGAVLAGEVQMAIESPPPIVPQVKAGRLRALGAARANRSPLLPDVPTTTEAGLPAFNLSVWFGLSAPKGTPRPIVEKLNKALGTALDDADTVKRFADLGYDVVPANQRSPEYFDKFVKDEVVLWRKVFAGSATGTK